MKKIKLQFIEKIQEGLARKSVICPSSWAEKYRVMPSGNFQYDRHPWAREVTDCDAPMEIAQKAAQMSFTEAAMNKTFYHIDIHGRSVLYVLPNKTPGASDFSTSRFDPALDLSPQLKKIFTDVKNTGHKRAGSANLFVRGSRSRTQLKSDPVAIMIFDEVEEMVFINIELALERMSGQDVTQAFLLSTPSVDGVGINFYFQSSTQDHWHFTCPHCGHFIELDHDPEDSSKNCLIITADRHDDPKIMQSHILCPRSSCRGVIAHAQKPEYYKAPTQWVKQFDSINRGFTISQLYSCSGKCHPGYMAQAYLKALTDEALMQEYWCSKHGKTYMPKGSRVNDSDIEKSIGNFSMSNYSRHSSLTTIGIDVGNVLHVEVCEWVPTGEISIDFSEMYMPFVIWAGHVKDFEDIDELVEKYRPKGMCVDAIPEKRCSMLLCKKYPDICKRVFYVHDRQGYGKQIKEHDDEDYAITVDRSYWLSVALDRIKNGRIQIPIDIPLEWRQHVKEPIRIYKRDPSTGQIFTNYVTKHHAADHLAHCRVYNELALQGAVSLASNKDYRG